MTAPAEQETLLERTNREFNAAVVAHDYAAALWAVRWIYNQRAAPNTEPNFERGVIDKIKTMTPKDAAANLRTSVLCAEPPDPALLLYVADLLEGANLGRRRNTTKVIVDEVKLLVRVGALFEQTDSSLNKAARMAEAYRLAAAEGFGNGSVETIARLYRRAKRNRPSG